MRRRGKTAFVVSFLAPAVTIYAVFVLLPLLQAAFISLERWKGVSSHRKFVGLENYAKLLHDDAFRMALGNALWLLVAAVVAVFVGGLAGAHGLALPGRAGRFGHRPARRRRDLRVERPGLLRPTLSRGPQGH